MLLAEALGDGFEGEGVADHAVVAGDGDAVRSPDLELGEIGAIGRQNEQVEGCPNGGELHLIELVNVLIKGLDEGAPRAHLADAVAMAEVA